MNKDKNKNRANFLQEINLCKRLKVLLKQTKPAAFWSQNAVRQFYCLLKNLVEQNNYFVMEQLLLSQSNLKKHFFFLKDNAFSDKHMYVHLSASSSGAAKYKHSNEPSVLNLLHKTVEKVCATVLLTRKANDFITTNL